MYWMMAKTKSITKCEGAFVYMNGAFTEVYSTESNQKIPAYISLNDFCSEVGIPEKLASDRVLELCSRKYAFLANAKNKGIDLIYAELERKNQIWIVHLEIRELKRRTHNKMISNGVPKRLWDFGPKHLAKIMKILPRKNLKG